MIQRPARSLPRIRPRSARSLMESVGIVADDRAAVAVAGVAEAGVVERVESRRAASAPLQPRAAASERAAKTLTDTNMSVFEWGKTPGPARVRLKANVGCPS